MKNKKIITIKKSKLLYNYFAKMLVTAPQLMLITAETSFFSCNWLKLSPWTFHMHFQMEWNYEVKIAFSKGVSFSWYYPFIMVNKKKMYHFNLRFIIHLICLNLCHATLDSTVVHYILMELSALSRSCESRILTGNMAWNSNIYTRQTKWVQTTLN